MNNLIYYVTIIIIILVYFNRTSTMPNMYVPPIKTVQLVVARYNENIHWINTYPFNQYPVVCYNKGANNNIKINHRNQSIVKLDNVGKCDHTYLYHIIQNYYNLADNTVFLPGSTHMQYKIAKAKRILYALENDSEKNSVFVFEQYYDSVKKNIFDFILNSHQTAFASNNIGLVDLDISKIRPFGKWFEYHFGDTTIQHISFWGIMSISKKNIHSHSKQYYVNLLKELETPNPEVGHYMERSWEAIFYPMSGAKFIQSNAHY